MLRCRAPEVGGWVVVEEVVVEKVVVEEVVVETVVVEVLAVWPTITKVFDIIDITNFMQ